MLSLWSSFPCLNLRRRRDLFFFPAASRSSSKIQIQIQIPAASRSEGCNLRIQIHAATKRHNNNNTVQPLGGEKEEEEEEEEMELKLESLRCRFHLHSRVSSLLTAGNLDDAAAAAISSSVLLPPLVETCNLVMAAMYDAKRYNDVKSLFHRFFSNSSNSSLRLQPDIQSYDILLQSLLCHDSLDQALQIYRYLVDYTHFHLSRDTYSHLIQSLIHARRITHAGFMLQEIPTIWESLRYSIYVNTILTFLKSRDVDDANRLFHASHQPIPAFAASIKIPNKYLPRLDPSLLDSFQKDPYQQEKDKETINKMVNKCFDNGKSDEAMDVFNQQQGFMDLFGFNNIISRLSNLRMMAEAEHYYQHLCNSFSTPDVHTYMPMIDAYISLDRVDNVLHKFLAMVNLKTSPATTTTTTTGPDDDAGCCYKTFTNKCFVYLIDRGRAFDCAPILSKMIRNGMEVEATTCNTVIRGLINQGHFDATLFDLLYDMKEFQCNIAGMHQMETSTNSYSSTMITTTATTADDDDDDLDDDGAPGGLIPPKEGELQHYGLQVDDNNGDPDLTIAALRPKFQLHHRVKILLRAGDLDAAVQTAMDSSFLPFADTCNEIMDALYRVQRYNDVKAVFDHFFDHGPGTTGVQLVQPVAKSYDIGIMSMCKLPPNYHEASHFDEIIDVEEQYLFMCLYTTLSPTVYAYLNITRKFLELDITGRIRANFLLLDMTRKWGKKYPWLYNLALLEYLNFGSQYFNSAKQMFHELKTWRCPDFTFTGVVDKAFLDSFPRDEFPKVVSSDAINTMVNNCFKAGKVKEAMDAFNSVAKGRELSMVTERVRMDLAGFNNIIAKLCELRMMDEAEHYYQQLWSSTYEIPDVQTYMPLIDAYVELDVCDKALDKIMTMLNLELVSDYSIPTSCLDKGLRCLCSHGRASDCAHILSKMLRKGMEVSSKICHHVIKFLFVEGSFQATLNLLCDLKEFERNINWN